MLILVILLAVVAIVLGGVAVWFQAEATKSRHALEKRAQYDALTGLPNRQGFLEWLEANLKEARRTNGRLTVFLVECWGLGHLNSTYGHEVGDALITAAAEDLQAVVGARELLARYSGPQFVIASLDVNDPGRAERRARELLQRIERPYEVGKDRIKLRASVGVVMTDQTYTAPEDVVLDATVALQDALAEGKGTLRIFDQTMRSTMTPSTAEHRLREALERGDFWLLYQPVVALDDGRIVGVEALLRWADPDSGLVSPASFMRALDETGLIVPVGTWVLREAARQAREWQDRFPGRELQVTVNASPRQIAQYDFLENVNLALDESGADPTGLCIEITEASFAQDPDATWSVLRQAKQRGCGLSLDDFGTGCSSFSYLRHFNMDVLKIDRTFVAGLDQSDEDRAIVAQMIGLAHALGMTATAEAVETSEQARLLRELGCDRAVGYHFSPPRSAEIVGGLLEQGRLNGGEAPGPSPERPGPDGTRVTPQLD